MLKNRFQSTIKLYNDDEEKQESVRVFNHIEQDENSATGNPIDQHQNRFDQFDIHCRLVAHHSHDLTDQQSNSKDKTDKDVI